MQLLTSKKMMKIKKVVIAFFFIDHLKKGNQ